MTEIKNPPIKFNESQDLISDIQNSLDGDFLAYWMSSDAIMNKEDVQALDKLLVGMKGKNLYLLIKSSGGNPNTSLLLVNLLREKFERITALVISECASAATQLALGADEILMTPHSHLSAIDTSIVHDLSPLDQYNNKVSVSLDELSRVTDLWNRNNNSANLVNAYQELYKYINPLVIGAVDRASSLSIKVCTEILSYHLTDVSKAQDISRRLNSDYPSHSYPITLREARKVGLNVDKMDADLERKLIALNVLNAEIAQNCDLDFDENNYHRHQVIKSFEAPGQRIVYKLDEQKHYRQEEKRWTFMHFNSGWYTIDTSDSANYNKIYLN